LEIARACSDKPSHLSHFKISRNWVSRGLSALDERFARSEVCM